MSIKQLGFFNNYFQSSRLKYKMREIKELERIYVLECNEITLC